MDPKKLIVSTLILIGLGLTGLRAQNLVSAAGGIASGSGGKVTYTAGQIVNSSISGIGGSATNNLQLPFEILIGTGIEEASKINLEVSAFPNPVNEVLFLKVEEYSIKNLSYQLYDRSGKLLLFQNLNGKETSISMENFPSATYFLKIIYSKGSAISQKEIKTFKILKN